MSMEISNEITSQVMDLKTSRPGVIRKEEIKTGFKNVDDYSKYLQGKYSYLNTGPTSMQGVPVNVNVSGAFLKKCMNDPEKAAYLEENLAAIPDCMKYAVNYTKGMHGSPVMTYANYSIDENGNISCMSGCTNDPDGKIARENAKRRAEEEKAAKKKSEKKCAEKEAEHERLKKLKNEKNIGEFTVSVMGTDTASITMQLAEKLLVGSRSVLSGFDVMM